MGQSKHERAHAHDEHPPAKPAWFVPRPTKITNKGQAHTRSDVIGACNEASLIAAKVKAPFNGRDYCVDETVDDHPLKERGHAKEEQHPSGGVEDLDRIGCKSPPATQVIRVTGEELQVHWSL